MKYREDLMGIVIEIEDAFLDKKLNEHSCNFIKKLLGFDDRKRTTVQSAMPPELAAKLDKLGDVTMAAYERGDLSRVAAADPTLQLAQEQAIGQARGLDVTAAQSADVARQMATGTGLFSARDLSAQQAALAADAKRRLGLGNVQRQAQAAMGGGAGGARAALAQREAESQAGTQLAGRLAELDAQDLAARRQAATGAIGAGSQIQQQSMAGAQALRGVGKERQAQAQREMDAIYQGISRAAGIFTGDPRARQTQTLQEGGKY